MINMIKLTNSQLLQVLEAVHVIIVPIKLAMDSYGRELDLSFKHIAISLPAMASSKSTAACFIIISFSGTGWKS